MSTVRRVKSRPRANLTIRLAHAERRLVGAWARDDGASKSAVMRDLIERERRRRIELDVQAMNHAYPVNAQ